MPRIKFLLTAVLLVIVQAVMAQGQRISGTVTDDFGGVMGASVVEIDANNRNVSATVTDINGNFSLAVKNTKNKLRISYVGAKTVTMPIGTRTNFSTKLGSSSTAIKEVKVTAKRRSNSGGLSIPKREVSVAQQTMDMSEVEGLAFTSADEALQGQIAGLDIVAGSGNLGSGTQMRLRGVTTINGNANPLIVVDDQIFDAPDFDAENATDEDYAALLSVNVEDIASITVLKDAASTAIWGSKGANGVIEIKRKRGTRGKTKVTYTYKFSGNWQPKGYKLLNGDEYTMLMKEEFFNPSQNSSSTENINELNYDQSWADYENWNNNTDWVDAVTKFGQSHEHSLNLTGGGEKATFRISASYLHQTGTIIEQTLNRFTTLMSLDYMVSDRIKFISTFSFAYTNNNKNYSDLLSAAQRLAPNMSIYRQDRNGNDTDEYQIMNASSGVRNPSSSDLKSVRDLGNPIAVANLAWAKENTYRVNPEFKLQYDLLGVEDDKSRLTYTGGVYFDIYAKSAPSYYPGELVHDATWGDNYNRSYNDESNSMKLTVTNDLVFKPHFKNEDWFSNIRARYQMVIGNSNRQYETDRWVPTGLDLSTLGAFMLASGTSSSTGKSRSQNWSVNGHISYKSRYSLYASIRADGDSRFGPKHKWAYFPSVSARWNISDEPFMKWSRKVVSMLAFRPSWGMVGNPPSSESLFYEMYSQNGNYGTTNGNGKVLTAMQLEQLKLDDLKWETTTSYNLGFNLGLFDDKIEAEVEYYYKKTDDLLMKNVRIPSTTGYSTLPWANVGSMTNEGWELNLSLNKILKIGKFSMSANFNIAQNYNEIHEMDDRVLENLNTDWSAANGTYLNRVQVGNPLGSIYGYRYKGVYQYSFDGAVNLFTKEQTAAAENGVTLNAEDWYNNWLASGHTAPFATDKNGKVLMDDRTGKPKHMYFDYSGKGYVFKGGDAIYEDVNHDGEINQYDIVYLGNSMPKVNGGFGLTFNYGRWTLKTNFNYRFGFKVVNMARMELEKMATANNQCATVNHRWRKDGDGFDNPVLPRAMYITGSTPSYNWLGSDRFVEDASFVRLQYVQLTYNFPTAMIKKLGLSNLKIYVSANNLYCWTKYSGTDPEHSSSYASFASDTAKTPRSKSFTATLSLGF